MIHCDSLLLDRSDTLEGRRGVLKRNIHGGAKEWIAHYRREFMDSSKFKMQLNSGAIEAIPLLAPGMLQYSGVVNGWPK
jgi:hypothetical protein